MVSSKALIALELLNYIVLERLRSAHIQASHHTKPRLILEVAVTSQSHTLNSATVASDVEVIRMPEEKKKIENAAEKTGEAVGKGVRKGAKAVSDFGKGVKKEIKKKE
jgi:hypothetical protein